MTVSQFLSLMEQPIPGENYYIAQQEMSEVFPELLRSISRPHFDKWLSVDRINFWMGSGGQITPLHFDDSENLLVMLAGKKTFEMYPPNQALFLYPLPHEGEDGWRTTTTKIDLRNPDYDRFPLYRNATPFRVTVEAGDMLFLPALWWHTVESSGTQNHH